MIISQPSSLLDIIDTTPQNITSVNLCIRLKIIKLIMIERLSQILVENTVSVEVKCVLNESVIDNNFRVIIDCLRDLENKQSSMQNLIEEINQRNAAMQKEIEGARIGTGAGIFSEENIRGGDGEDRVSISSRKEERGKEEREGREEREKGVENHSVQKMENEGEMRELIRQIQD